MQKPSMRQEIGAMKLVEPTDGAPIPGLAIPKDLYWVISSPTPLAGMRQPVGTFPWPALNAAGFSEIVCLHPGAYDHNPLNMAFASKLKDLSGGGRPDNDREERLRIRQAVDATLQAWRAGRGVVVHCQGGRGRTGTVLGCVLRELGFGAAQAVDFLNRVHKARGKPGWPESAWQSELVRAWNPAA